MAETAHFLSFDSLREAEAHMGFRSLARNLQGDPMAIRVHIRDHKLREVVPTLELYYEAFDFCQTPCGGAEARRRAFDESYGSSGFPARVGGHRAKMYELGDEPPVDDPDPRPPSVVVWADGEILCFLASDELAVAELTDIANSLYP